MKNNRPVNLNLFSIKLIKTAIASILHRISGIIIFLFLWLFIYILDLSLYSEQTFNLLQKFFNENFIFKVFLWIISTATIYHAILGIRHILIDFSLLKEDLKTANITANIAFLFTITTSILLGIFLW
ncbi:MAG: succinate dehydrogenase, cytochrome b556 subunit [Wigglesworthia glossinidia]|nr:succinate dehydrogenase, cytochrome b556 subunit [Wigglesworthia glossinidia]